jgi:hypothetical protein
LALALHFHLSDRVWNKSGGKPPTPQSRYGDGALTHSKARGISKLTEKSFR